MNKLIWKKKKQEIKGYINNNIFLGSFEYHEEKEKWIWQQNGNILTHYAYLKDIIKKEKELNK